MHHFATTALLLGALYSLSSAANLSFHFVKPADIEGTMSEADKAFMVDVEFALDDKGQPVGGEQCINIPAPNWKGGSYEYPKLLEVEYFLGVEEVASADWMPSLEAPLFGISLYNSFADDKLSNIAPDLTILFGDSIDVSKGRMIAMYNLENVLPAVQGKWANHLEPWNFVRQYHCFRPIGHIEEDQQESNIKFYKENSKAWAMWTGDSQSLIGDVPADTASHSKELYAAQNNDLEPEQMKEIFGIDKVKKGATQ